MRLFEILENEILKSSKEYKKDKDVLLKIFAAIEDTISFRRNVSMDESTDLKKAKDELWIKTAKTADLINKFYSNLDFEGQESRGDLR